MRSKKRKPKLLYTVFAVAAVLFVCVIAAGTVIAVRLIDNEAARREYARLRNRDETPLAQPSPVPTVTAFETERVNKLTFDPDELAAVNPDFIGWLYIEGTKMDYPVVRGADNTKYLNTTFSGERNQNGAIFMDYRCADGFTPHLIIYGHNADRGEMFSGLLKYLEEPYVSENPIIVVSIGGVETEYAIFAARKTDVFDPAYQLGFNGAEDFGAYAEKCGAPGEAVGIITLSTCVNGPNQRERVIVQGAAIVS